MTTIAGGGVEGAGPNSRHGVRFSDPFGVATAPDGAIFVADGAGAHRIYRVAPDGTVAVFAGSSAGFTDGSGPRAQFNTPSALALHPDGSLYVADTGNDAIRRIAPDGSVTTVTPAGESLNGPVGIAVGTGGRVIVADTYNDRIVTLDERGAVIPLAGGPSAGFADGPAASARFDTPTGVAVDGGGHIFVADAGNGAVRVISPEGVVSTIAPGYADGSLRPIGVAVTDDGAVFVTDDRGRVVELTPGAGQRRVAGGERGFADGDGERAMFRAPAGIAAIARGKVIVTDRRNGLVRMISARSQKEMRPPPPPMRIAFDTAAFDRVPLLWPFAPLEGPFEITGTLGEPRGGEGSERFHAGLDVHAAEGTPVRVVRAATSEDPLAAFDFGSLNESVRLGPVTYIHLRVGRDHRGTGFNDGRFVFTRDDAGAITRVRVKRGSRFAAGEVIGTVNRFYHAHLNVGWPGEEINPLHFRLTRFDDSIPPVIARGGIRIIGENGAPLTVRARGRLLVSGRVRVVVDAWDQVNGNQARRRLGLYRLGYQLLNADGTPAEGFAEPRETIVFNRQPLDAAAARVVYAAGSGIPVYGSRSTRFLYVVTSTLRDGIAADGTLDTATLPPGDYTLRILAADIRGNEAVANRDLPISLTRGAGE